MYECKICKYSTDRKLNIDRHNESKKHSKNVQLSQDATKTKNDFKKKHQCVICDYETTSTSNLRKHLGSDAHLEKKGLVDFNTIDYVEKMINNFVSKIKKYNDELKTLEATIPEDERYEKEDHALKVAKGRIEDFENDLKKYKYQKANLEKGIKSTKEEMDELLQR